MARTVPLGKAVDNHSAHVTIYYDILGPIDSLIKLYSPDVTPLGRSSCATPVGKLRQQDPSVVLAPPACTRGTAIPEIISRCFKFERQTWARCDTGVRYPASI
jgi:hypothetical protein